LDLNARNEIIATFSDGKLIGSYIEKDNVIIEIKNKNTILFTVNPFGEFEPIIKDEYRKQ
jgi:hypothetical protein